MAFRLKDWQVAFDTADVSWGTVAVHIKMDPDTCLKHYYVYKCQLVLTTYQAYTCIQRSRWLH